jgi:hypothetical protein
LKRQCLEGEDARSEISKQIKRTVSALRLQALDLGIGLGHHR